MSWWLLTFSRRGPARYVSHLDTVRALQRTLTRAGIELAMTQGMRPKPRISLPLALPVGAAADTELAVVEVSEAHDLEAPCLLRALRDAGPSGLRVERVEEAEGRPRPQAATAAYDCFLPAQARDARAALAWYLREPEVVVQRRSPKGRRVVDLKKFVVEPQASPEGDGTRLAFVLRYTDEGSARPDEFVTLLSARLGIDPLVRDLVRRRVDWQGLAPGPGAED